jgi:hypothetical protein
MTPREQFRALAMQHGMRDAHYIELAEAAGLVRDIDTKQGRESSLRAFKEAKPHLFGTGADHSMPVATAMGHAEFGSKSDAQARADRKMALDRHVGPFLGRVKAPEKRATAMTAEEAAELERDIIDRERHNMRISYQRAIHSQILDG